MATDPGDVEALLKLIRMDLTQLQARVTDLGRMVTALDLPTPARHPCSECGLEFASASQLRDHLVNVHEWQTELEGTGPRELPPVAAEWLAKHSPKQQEFAEA